MKTIPNKRHKTIMSPPADEPYVDYTLNDRQLATWATASLVVSWKSFVPSISLQKYESLIGPIPRGLEPKSPWSAFHTGKYGIAIHPGGTICIRTIGFMCHLTTIDPEGVVRFKGRELELYQLGGRSDIHDGIEAVKAWVLRAEGRSLPPAIPELLKRIEVSRAMLAEQQEAWANMSAQEHISILLAEMSEEEDDEFRQAQDRKLMEMERGWLQQLGLLPGDAG